MTKSETEKLSDFLRDNEVSADYYHAGMTKSVKQNVQAAWLEEKIHVVCATIAYGETERERATDPSAILPPLL
jgi:superfamily II DNA helicase RecQ